MSGTGVLGIVGAVTVILVVLRLVTQRRLLVKYAALWLFVSIVLVVMAVVPASLSALADLLGFEVPANLLFFSGFSVLLFVVVQLSVELTSVERRIQRLVEEIALLRESRDEPGPR